MQLQSGIAANHPSLNGSVDQTHPVDLNKFIVHSLEESKAENIVSIDITGKSPICDMIVVASGRSQRHVKSIADNLIRGLKKSKLANSRVEGLSNCDWVLLDAGDVVVHLFRPEVREFYNLEKMWSTDHLD